MGQIKVYVLAESEALRFGLVASFRKEVRLEVIGEAASIQEMTRRPDFETFDVLVVDVDLLTASNQSLVDGDRPAGMPAIRVLFLGTQQDEQSIRPEDIPAYMELETVGFLLKNSPIERIVEAIKLVASGAFVCEAALIKRMLTRLITWASYGPSEHNQLSGREREVLALVACGKSNREIAHALFVSEGTIRAHASHLLTKLGLDRRTELVRYALVNGLVPVPAE